MSARTTRKRARTEYEQIQKQEPEEEADATALGTRADSGDDPQPGGPHRERERSDSAPALERDPEFWFSDGTIILVAENIEFRFYRALLAEHSPMFKAMFAEQHPSRLVPIDEHHSIPCPVVQLSDSPGDLRHILRAYISGKHTSFLGVTKPSFHQISAYIRLGRKYELNELYEQSRQFLKEHYTDDLDAWTEHEHWEPSYWDGNESIGVVNLARLINEPSLLPTALLSCVYMDATIARGFQKEDGTHETLTPDDLGRCFKANRDIGAAHIAGLMRTFQDKTSPDCKKEKGKSCNVAFRSALRRIEAKMHSLMSNGPFLEFDELLRGIGIPINRELGTCAACRTMVEGQYEKECEALWARLPELLGIEVPGWGGNVRQGEAVV